MKTLLRVMLFALFLVASPEMVTVQCQASTTTLLTQISQAFIANGTVSSVQLSATANWYAGSFEDTGSATLTASASGASRMQLNLAKKGEWIESQGGIDPGMKCSWAGSDATAHTLGSSSCVKPTVWFLPAMALQPNFRLASITATDLGMGLVGKSTYRHARLQFLSGALYQGASATVAQDSAIDIGVDPSSFLPQVMVYQVPPDDGSPVQVPVEVHFSDYRTVQGAQIPFRIQRYVNGTLQLDLTITTAQIT